MSGLMSLYRSVGDNNGKDSPRLSSGGTQRSNISLSKVEPWTGTDNESLELISNPGSGKGSRNLTQPKKKEIQPFKPDGNGLLYFANEGLPSMEDVNALDSEGLSALHRAVRFDDFKGVGFLLDNGADVNLAGKSGFTPLHAAVRFERVEIAKLLLQRGADPLIENDSHLTPLHLAARRGFMELSSLLLKNSTVQTSSLDRGSTIPPFHFACGGGSLEVCELFLKSGADITSKNLSGGTPLQIAAWCGYEDICQLLLETGNHLLSL
ncbi:uncharacterized protein LOC144640751 [Oculina patagonica]